MNTITAPNLSQATGPKYKALADVIRKAITAGQLSVGDKLPPVRDLAYDLAITPGTVARAYRTLIDAGVLEAGVGRGTFVSSGRITIPINDAENEFWAQSVPPAEATSAVLTSPHLPDVGQVNRFRSLLKGVSTAQAEMLLQYPSRKSFRPVREAVVEWVKDIPLGSISEEDIVMSHGGQNAILLAMQTILHGPTPTILVEDLSYPGFRRAAETLRARTVALPMDDHGLLPEAFDKATQTGTAQVLCLMPEVHNPTTRHMPLERRQELARIAEARNIQIIEDDCYRLGPTLAPAFRSIAPTRGWYVSSFSKSLTPAFRIGFAIAPRGRGAELRRAAEHGFFGLAMPLAEIAREVMQSPATTDLTNAVRAEFARYIKVAVNRLGRFDISWRPDVPFLWLPLPSGWRASAFCRAAEKEGVVIRSADEFVLREERAPHAIRIAINAQISLASFEAAMERLARLLDDPPDQISV